MQRFEGPRGTELEARQGSGGSGQLVRHGAESQHAIREDLRGCAGWLRQRLSPWPGKVAGGHY